MKNSLRIQYKNVKHAIEAYKILKEIRLNYLNVGRLIPQSDSSFLVELNIKEYPYCPMRSTWDSVKLQDRIKLTSVKYKSTYISEDCQSFYKD